jgi:manganese efflux pump family protein
MDSFTITAIALGLSFDTFAVSLSYGIIQNKIQFHQASGIALTLAFFQGGMVVGGYFLGSIISDALNTTDHWVALGLLSFLGMKMVISGFKESEERKLIDYNKVIVLFTVAIGTSIDAFAVGVSFAFLKIFIWRSGIIIGIVTYLASMIAIRLGKSAGPRLGNKVEIIGGLILIVIGIKIFLEHILAGNA